MTTSLDGEFPFYMCDDAIQKVAISKGVHIVHQWCYKCIYIYTYIHNTNAITTVPWKMCVETEN